MAAVVSLLAYIACLLRHPSQRTVSSEIISLWQVIEDNEISDIDDD
jgi:hypothetical protein